MTLTLICPKCGKEKPKEEFINNICFECFFKDKEFIDLKLKDLTICKSCGRIFYKNKWQNFSEDDIKNIVEENLKIDFDNYEIKQIKIDYYKDKVIAHVKIKGTINNHSLITEKEFIINFSKQNCDDCYRTMSNYYQAIVQIRYTNEELEKYKELLKPNIKSFMTKLMLNSIKEVRKDGDFLAYIDKIEDTKNGFDFYIGSKNLAMEFIRKVKQYFDYERKDSKSLVGIDKKGKAKLRYTYLIRLK